MPAQSHALERFVLTRREAGGGACGHAGWGGPTQQPALQRLSRATHDPRHMPDGEQPTPGSVRIGRPWPGVQAWLPDWGESSDGLCELGGSNRSTSGNPIPIPTLCTREPGTIPHLTGPHTGAQSPMRGEHTGRPSSSRLLLLPPVPPPQRSLSHGVSLRRGPPSRPIGSVRCGSSRLRSA